MTKRADRFAIHFAILFLCVLLAMFALFHFMRANDGRAIEKSAFRFTGQQGVLNFTEAFQVNLFLIDLSLLLIVESVLIFIFVRYTVPALAISSGVIVALVFAGRGLFERGTIQHLFVRFARTEYAALGLGDIGLLFALNALLLAFLVAMMHHYQQFELDERAAASRAEPLEAAKPAPAAEAPAERPAEAPPSQV
jgi:hypothetical protein